MAEFVCHQPSALDPIQAFNNHWGIDPEGKQPGALLTGTQYSNALQRHVTLLQRKAGKFGRSLGKTTGWIHLAELQKSGVTMLGDLNYI